MIIEKKQKIACLIGSTSGIGLATAESFLKCGYKVFIHGRDKKKLNRVLLKLSKKYPNQAEGYTGDVTDEKERRKLALSIKKTSPALDALVLCVGNGNVKKDIFLSQSDWDSIFSQNFFGNVHMTQLLSPLLERSDNASICYIGSIAGQTYVPAPIAYSVAKSALNTHAKYLSRALADKDIRVNIVHPGNIMFPGGRWEELVAQDPKGVEEYINEEVPQKRLGTPQEVAEAIVFLASPKASFITGASLIIDGGQTKFY